MRMRAEGAIGSYIVERMTSRKNADQLHSNETFE